MMKKWYDEEYQWRSKSQGFSERPHRGIAETVRKSDSTPALTVALLTRMGGDCSKVMVVMFPIMEAVSGGLGNLGGESKYARRSSAGRLRRLQDDREETRERELL